MLFYNMLNDNDHTHPFLQTQLSIASNLLEKEGVYPIVILKQQVNKLDYIIDDKPCPYLFFCNQ